MTSRSEAGGPASIKVVALGGGHGLHASLSAMLRLDVDITAVVTVADDGGSSGRIRRELGVLPPGDLRMALVALTDGSTPASAPDLDWDTLLQHRLGGFGALAGHPVGNLLLTGLLELHPDPVVALDIAATLVGARGRVLPMSPVPLDLVAEVATVDADDPVRSRVIRGQTAIASTSGRVRSIRVLPEQPPACAEAVHAVRNADVVVLGPGSWFTSVLPHLLVPELAAALVATPARLVCVLNLEPQVGETDGFSGQDHLRVLREYCPQLQLDVIVADAEVPDPDGLTLFAKRIGARLVLAPVADDVERARHDPVRLAAAITAALGLDAGTPSTTTSGRQQPVRSTTQQGVH